MGFGISSLAPKGESALKSLAAGLTAKLNTKISETTSEQKTDSASLEPIIKSIT